VGAPSARPRDDRWRPLWRSPVRGHRRRPRPAADKPAVTRQRTCLCL